jgi:hypothetical protein
LIEKKLMEKVFLLMSLARCKLLAWSMKALPFEGNVHVLAISVSPSFSCCLGLSLESFRYHLKWSNMVTKETTADNAHQAEDTHLCWLHNYATLKAFLNLAVEFECSQKCHVWNWISSSCYLFCLGSFFILFIYIYIYIYDRVEIEKHL